MVLGYQCPEHGYERECGVDESGERTCPECGTAVTGISGRTRDTFRSPPTDSDHASGDIKWRVSTGYGSDGFYVNAFGFEDAVEQAIDRADDVVVEVEPDNWRYANQ